MRDGRDKGDHSPSLPRSLSFSEALVVCVINTLEHVHWLTEEEREDRGDGMDGCTEGERAH